MEVDIEGSGMQYQPGDSIGFLPHNDAQLVEGVLSHLRQDGDQVFSIASSSGEDAKLLQHLGWPCSLRRALTVGCDLTSIPRSAAAALPLLQNLNCINAVLIGTPLRLAHAVQQVRLCKGRMEAATLCLCQSALA